MATNRQAVKQARDVLHVSAAYDFAVIQAGSMPLDPSGQRRPAIAHRCTSTLVWTDREDVPMLGRDLRNHDIYILTDPCLMADAAARITSLLGALGKSFADRFRF